MGSVGPPQGELQLVSKRAEVRDQRLEGCRFVRHRGKAIRFMVIALHRAIANLPCQPPRLNGRLCVAILLFSALLTPRPAQPVRVARKQTASSAVLKVGNGVCSPGEVRSRPRVSDQARAAAYEGTCVLSLVLAWTADLANKVARQRNGLEEKAIWAVGPGKFETGLRTQPGTFR